MAFMNNRGMSITTALILSNVAVYLLGAILPTVPAYFGIPYPGAVNNAEPLLFVRGAYSWYTCFMEGQIWRLFSYQFLHAGMLHLFFNMWVLYFFGPAAEEAMGPRRFLAFYLACGVAGALFSSLLSGLGLYHGELSLPLYAVLQGMANYVGEPSLELWQVVPMVGASAAIYGVLVAVAFLYPHLRISLIFPPITMTLRNFALAVMALAVLTVLTRSSNAGGEAGHLGGIILAAIIMSIWRWRYMKKRRDDGTF